MVVCLRTHLKCERQTDRLRSRQTERQTDIDRHRDRETDKQRQTERKIGTVNERKENTHVCTCQHTCIYESANDKTVYSRDRAMAYRYFPDGDGAAVRLFDDDGRMLLVPVPQWDQVTSVTSREDDVLVCGYPRSGICCLARNFPSL